MSVGESVAILNKCTSHVDGNMHHQTETGEWASCMISGQILPATIFCTHQSSKESMGDLHSR